MSIEMISQARRVVVAAAIAMATAWPDAVAARSAPYLVRDIEDQRPGRLPFSGALWEAPNGVVLPSPSRLWRLEENGSVTALVEGWVPAQLPSRELIVFGESELFPPGSLLRSDGMQLQVLGSHIVAQASAPDDGRTFAQLGDGVVLNGRVGSPRDLGNRAHWLVDGLGQPVEIGPYGQSHSGNPFEPSGCTESIELAGGILFCADETSGPAKRLWFYDANTSASAPISDTRSSYFSFRANDGLVFGLLPGGAFRSDGTAAGTTLFDGLGHTNTMYTGTQPRLWGDGIAWATTSGPGRLWFLAKSGSPTMLLEGHTDLKLMATAGETAFVQLESELLAISQTGSVTELGEFPWLLFGAPLGPDRALLGVPREPGHIDLVVADGTTVFTLVEGASDHEGPTAGSASHYSLVDDGVVVGLYDEEGEARPWLIGPTLELQPWRDVRLAGTKGSNPSPLRELGGRLLFLARSISGGTRPWWSDGTALGTQPASATR